MDKSLFKYIWQHSRRDQVLICAVVLLSLPFYYLSLDLPRRIVNEAIQGGAFRYGNETVPFLVMGFELPHWLGGAYIALFDGFPANRIQLLFGLSFAFLFYVLINGAFKYWINLAKGALGERMLRRMRFELVTLIMRFKPEALRKAKAAEIATIVKDEVEPIGGFIGDAFILPMFLGTQAATALFFIIMQSEWLGLMAAAIVGVQLIIIPRLRRKLLVLGRERQLVSRRLAGRIGEIFESQETMRLHNTAEWERADIGDRLYRLFAIRYEIYKRKFIVKFLNNLLAQMTPFLFYAIGGYFAVTGRMDIGQLVAVIAAYRDLPPPLKELIDWDQQRLDVQVKYDQVVQQFAPDRLLPPEKNETGDEEQAQSFGSPLTISYLRGVDVQGTQLFNGLSFEVPLPGNIALVGEQAGQASALARIMAQPESCAIGHIRVGDLELTTLTPDIRARRIGYVNGESTLFPGTIRDNLLYGLKSRHIEHGDEHDRLRLKRQMEAQKTGNPLVKADDHWVSFEQAGVDSLEELDRLLLDNLRTIGLGEDIYRLGLFRSLDPERHPVAAEGIVEARQRLHEKLQNDNVSRLVEVFDPERYNTQATVAENLLFGVPLTPSLIGAAMASHKDVGRVLRVRGLAEVFVELGSRIAETMLEIFRDLTPGHPLFEQFSFVSAEDLDDYAGIVSRWKMRRGRVSKDEKTQLIALALAYIEPRHRFGLLDDAVRARIVAARKPLMEMFEALEPDAVEFYQHGKFCAAAPVRDNILFGKVDVGIANARDRVAEAMGAVVEELGLRHTIERIGLGHQVGMGGRLLTAQQRVGVDLMRNLVKKPAILVVDGAFAAFPPTVQRNLRQFLVEQSRQRGMTLMMTMATEDDLSCFDCVVRVTSEAAEVEKMTDMTGESTTHAAVRAQQEGVRDAR